MENKRVAAITLVMALAFGGICYYGYGRYNVLKETQAKISEIDRKLEDYASESIPPKAKNRDLITQAAKDAKSLRDNLYADLLQYASFCIAGQGAQASSADGQSASPIPTGANAYMPETNPNQFQANLKALISSLGKYANEKGCVLGVPGQNSADYNVARFGNYSVYEGSAAKQENTPYLNFLIYAADDVMRHIIDSGAPSIKKLYFRDLPEVSPNRDKLVRLGFEVVFTAKRSDLINPEDPTSQSVLPQVINKITHDKLFFFIPTGIAVAPSVKNLPEAELALLDAADAAAAEAVAGESEEENETTPAEPLPMKVATPLVGKSSETVDVYLTLQVLYFLSDKF